MNCGRGTAAMLDTGPMRDWMVAAGDAGKERRREPVDNPAPGALGLLGLDCGYSDRRKFRMCC